MPAWIHSRATHILAKHPSMPKSEAFAIATNQSHALGKTPKSYGTVAGRKRAKDIYTTPRDDKKTANPGHLVSAAMEKKSWQDELSGGKADKKSPSEFDPKSLRAGMHVEREHTSNKHLQKEVAMDHLTEDPHYYEKLRVMEGSTEKKATQRGFFDELSKILGV